LVGEVYEFTKIDAVPVIEWPIPTFVTTKVSLWRKEKLEELANDAISKKWPRRSRCVDIVENRKIQLLATEAIPQI